MREPSTTRTALMLVGWMVSMDEMLTDRSKSKKKNENEKVCKIRGVV